MNLRASDLHTALQAALQPTHLEVLDESAAHAGHMDVPDDSPGGTHFRVRIASPAFAGLRRVAAHRLVYDALQTFIDQGLHALAIEIISSPT